MLRRRASDFAGTEERITTNAFEGSPLDRAYHLRLKTDLLNDALKSPTSRFVALSSASAAALLPRNANAVKIAWLSATDVSGSSRAVTRRTMTAYMFAWACATELRTSP